MCCSCPRYQSWDLQLYSQCPEDWANLAAFMQSFFYRVYWPKDAGQEPSFNWISSIAMSPLKLLPLTPSKTSWTQKYEVSVTQWTFFKSVRNPLYTQTNKQCIYTAPLNTFYISNSYLDAKGNKDYCCYCCCYARISKKSQLKN